MKVKLITTPYERDDFEEEINRFIKNKKVIDIKFTEVRIAGNYGLNGGWSALVMYEEK